MVIVQVEQRYLAWWFSLSDEQQASVLAVTAEMPPWMVDSLKEADIVVVYADLAGPSPVALMPTRLREFLEQEVSRATYRPPANLRWSC